MDKELLSSKMNEIMTRIKDRRLELNLSYQDLADRTGLSKSTLQRYETGFIKNMPMDKLEILANALNTSSAYLMGWEDDSTSENYYLDNDARDLAEFLFENPEYKVLFDASRKVKKEDIEFVKQMIDRMRGGTDDTGC